MKKENLKIKDVKTEYLGDLYLTGGNLFEKAEEYLRQILPEGDLDFSKENCLYTRFHFCEDIIIVNFTVRLDSIGDYESKKTFSLGNYGKTSPQQLTEKLKKLEKEVRNWLREVTEMSKQYKEIRYEQ